MGAMSVLATNGADTHSIQPMGLIRHLSFILGGHTFTILVVVLRLDAPRAYSMLLRRPWLRTANIKQHWQRKMISFRHGKTTQDTTPLYAEGVHMFDGLADEEVDHFLEEHSTIVPLFEIDVLTIVRPYVSEPTTEENEVHQECDPTSIEKLRHARNTLDHELAISQRVKVEEVNLGSSTKPRTLKIATELASDERSALVGLLMEYQDVFAWSFEDMKGLDLTFCQHQINLHDDVKPMQLRRYRLNPNYIVKVKKSTNYSQLDLFIRLKRQLG